MTDIFETATYYERICRGNDTPYHPMVQAVLDFEKDETLIHCKSCACLYLAGNNKVMSSNVRLMDRDAKIFHEWLKDNIYIVGLDLRYNCITDEGAKHIAQLLRENRSLHTVNLMCNDIGEEGAQHLAASLHKNNVLRCLRVNGNKIGNKGGLYFAQALQINITLELLDLADCDLKIEAVIALSTVLNYNTSLKALNVSRPLLFTQQEETTDHFARMLKVNSSLLELHLMKYEMRDFGATLLADNLCHNFTLTYLNLSCNRITRDGAKKIADLLRRDTALQILELGINRIGDDGAIHIAEALALCNTNLKTLSITSNEITGKGLCAIADCMRTNSSLVEVFIVGNYLDESACIAFKNLIDTSRLHLKNTDVVPFIVDGVVQLAHSSNGVRCWYYWGPTYGENAQPELAQFVSFPCPKSYK